METQSQDDLKIDIKIWLKKNKHDYAWLAEKSFVSESTVRNWMAQKSIPKAKEHIIRQLMKETPIVMPQAQPSSAVEVRSETILTLKLDTDTRRRLEDKAFAQGCTLEEFLSRMVIDITSE